MGAPWEKTEDGIESQFATNHVGNFLFINLIMPKLLAASAPRVLVVSSVGHFWGPVRFDVREICVLGRYGRTDILTGLQLRGWQGLRQVGGIVSNASFRLSSHLKFPFAAARARLPPFSSPLSLQSGTRTRSSSYSLAT